jgi:hypothetical protein
MLQVEARYHLLISISYSIPKIEPELYQQQIQQICSENWEKEDAAVNRTLPRPF